MASFETKDNGNDIIAIIKKGIHKICGQFSNIFGGPFYYLNKWYGHLDNTSPLQCPHRLWITPNIFQGGAFKVLKPLPSLDDPFHKIDKVLFQTKIFSLFICLQSFVQSNDDDQSISPIYWSFNIDDTDGL